MNYRSFVFKALAILSLLVGLLNFNANVLAQTNKQAVRQPLKVGFILCGPVTDHGWNQAHNEGRLYVEKHMGNKVQTVFAESVPENSDAARVMEKMIAQGVKVIFATSYGYLEPILQIASRHPDVIFMQSNRCSEQSKPNVGGYFVFYYEPLYVAGMVAGRMTKSNKIGFIVGHSVPSVLCGVNAFTLGARSVNPKVHVHIVCTNSWGDPATESEATKALIEGGNDVLIANLNSSLSVCQVAASAGVYCMGIHYDIGKQFPHAWLTGQYWNRGPLYEKLISEVINDSWKPVTKYYRAKDGYALLSSFGQAVPKVVQEEALRNWRKIKTGEKVVFKGPIKDREGTLRIPAGDVADNHCIEQMNWVVPGVEGALSSK